jgi:hypothetical protein
MGSSSNVRSDEPANQPLHGSAMQIGTLDAFAPGVAPGVELFVTRVAIPGGTRGKILIRGSLKTVGLGGQELFIDNRECTHGRERARDRERRPSGAGPALAARHHEGVALHSVLCTAS